MQTTGSPTRGRDTGGRAELATWQQEIKEGERKRLEDCILNCSITNKYSENWVTKNQQERY